MLATIIERTLAGKPEEASAVIQEVEAKFPKSTLLPWMKKAAAFVPEQEPE